MPITTEKYFLHSMLDGDIYSAAADLSRFTTIDNQLHRIAELIKNGVIDGWSISDNTFPNIKISAGNGLIDGFYVNVFDDQYFDLESNSTYNIYAQRKIVAEDDENSIRPNIVGIDGPNSNVAFLEYNDSAAPAQVQNCDASRDTYDPSLSTSSFNVYLFWDHNTENDLYGYYVYRSTNGTNFTQLTFVAAGTNLYTDSTVDEDTQYWYRITAIDYSGNESIACQFTITTPVDESLPTNPFEVIAKSSDSDVNVLWKRPPTLTDNKLDHYIITIAQLDTDSSHILSTNTEYTVDKSLYNYRIDELINGEPYEITIQAVDTKDRLSTGIIKTAIPQQSTAPLDPESISYTTRAGSENNVIVDLSWSENDDPYHPFASYRFEIYTQIDGQDESFPVQVPVGKTTHTVELYSMGSSDNRPIPENTLVTFRILAIGTDGFKSRGGYIRFVTPRYTIPNPVRNINATFNPGENHIFISWLNNADTANIKIEIYEQDPEDPYEAYSLIISEFLGIANKYYIENVQLSFKYKIVITPYDVFGNEGVASTMFFNMATPGEVDLPEPPESITYRSGDKELALTWTPSSSDNVTYYRIYKHTGVVSFEHEDWNILDTISAASEGLQFIDYGLENNQTYSYYITSIDHYGRESEHLDDGFLNLNFLEAEPLQSSQLTAPYNTALSFVGTNNNIRITWQAENEEFDSFRIYRSEENLHEWEIIATVDKNTLTYTDTGFLRQDGINIYYMIEKTLNDSQLIVQLSSITPENSIFLGTVQTLDNTFVIDESGRRIIKNLEDTIADYTNELLLVHKHAEIGENDPDRIDLSRAITITNWTTADDRVFTTTEDMTGTSYIVKVNSLFPTVYFEVNGDNQTLIFAEAIASDATVEVEVIGGEEVDVILDAYRVDDIHARQVTTGRIIKEQLPGISHEGRLREMLTPSDYLLERYNNYTFIVPQGNTNTNKTFGTGMTFFTMAGQDGYVNTVFDFDDYADGSIVAFSQPYTYSDTKSNNNVMSFSYIIDSNANNAERSTDGGAPPTIIWNSVTLIFGLFVTRFSTYIRYNMNIPRDVELLSSNIILTSSSAVFNGVVNATVNVLDSTSTNDASIGFSLVNDGFWEGLSRDISLDWNIPAAAWADEQRNDNTTTPDMTSIIQYIIDNENYNANNNIVFTIEVTAGVASRDAASYTQSLANPDYIPPELTGTYIYNTAEVTSEISFQQDKSYKMQFQFADVASTRWIGFSTASAANKPNPIIDLSKKLRFWIYLESGSIYVTLGVRETQQTIANVGDNGGTTGPIEWVGATDLIEDSEGNFAPKGKLIEGSARWQLVEFDIPIEPVVSYIDGNNNLDTRYGVLHHLAFTSTGTTGPFTVYISNFEQTNDLVVAGTSQGIRTSDNYGSTWDLVRYTTTPVKKFYQATNNSFLWAITSDQVLLSTHPKHWFVTAGTLGINNIRDILEDDSGNMYVSTDKGVYKLYISLLTTYGVWKQTAMVEPFSTDCFGLHHVSVSSQVGDN